MFGMDLLRGAVNRIVRYERFGTRHIVTTPLLYAEGERVVISIEDDPDVFYVSGRGPGQLQARAMDVLPGWDAAARRSISRNEV